MYDIQMLGTGTWFQDVTMLCVRSSNQWCCPCLIVQKDRVTNMHALWVMIREGPHNWYVLSYTHKV